MNFTLRLVLLLVAVVLFVLAAFVDDPTTWWSLGLAAFAAAFLVSEAGWDRSFASGDDRSTTTP